MSKNVGVAGYAEAFFPCAIGEIGKLFGLVMYEALYQYIIHEITTTFASPFS